MPCRCLAAARRKTPTPSPPGQFRGKAQSRDRSSRIPDLARSFRLLQQHGRDVFYKGEIARAIVAKSNAVGGTMTLQDLANYTAEWTTPATTNYHGYEVSELPPPSQAWATDEMLNILEVCVPKLGYDLAQLGPASPEFWHLLLEAKKLAYSDLFAYNGDPNFVTVPLDKLLSKSYAATLCSQINPAKAGPAGVKGNAPGDTIVLSTADRWGNMVSLVNSNYAAFGSGITVPGYGFRVAQPWSLVHLESIQPQCDCATQAAV